MDLVQGLFCVPVEQDANTHRQAAGHGHLLKAQQRSVGPSQLSQRHSGADSVQVCGGGKEHASDVRFLDPIPGDDLAQQLLGCGEDRVGLVVGDSDGAPDASADRHRYSLVV